MSQQFAGNEGGDQSHSYEISVVLKNKSLGEIIPAETHIY
jgi:hypothetical protein